MIELLEHLLKKDIFESFWAATTEYSPEDSNDANTFLDFPGIPGGGDNISDFLARIERILIDTDGKITDVVIDIAKKQYSKINGFDFEKVQGYKGPKSCAWMLVTWLIKNKGKTVATLEETDGIEQGTGFEDVFKSAPKYFSY